MAHTELRNRLKDSDYLDPLGGRWTVEDLDALPESNVRRDLVDGVLMEMPGPTTRHQTLRGLLYAELDSCCPDDLVVIPSFEVRFGRHNCQRPDLVVGDNAAIGSRDHFTGPSAVHLAVEIVALESTTLDRYLRPACYAREGIRHFWRISLDQPWKIDIPFEKFVPRTS